MPDVVTLGEVMALFAPLEGGPLTHVRRFELRVGGAEARPRAPRSSRTTVEHKPRGIHATADLLTHLFDE